MGLQPLPRRDTIRYKLMPDGHIRAYQGLTKAKNGAPEYMIYPPHICAPTVTTSGHTNLLITDNRILSALDRAQTYG